MQADPREIRRVRALFISDVHLGMRPIRVAQLIDFLRWHDADVMYLVGDIVDGWRLAKILALAGRIQPAGASCCWKRRRPARAWWSCPATTTNSCATISAPISARSSSSTAPSTPRRRARPISSSIGDQFDVVVRHGQRARPCRGLGLSLRAARQHRHQLDPAPAGAQLLVALRLGQEQVKECRQRHRPLRRSAVAGKPATAASTASSAAISTTPTCTTGWASTTSIPATGWESCTAIAEEYDGQFELITWTAMAPQGAAAAPAETATREGHMSRILIVTDAWYPQTNGVVRCLDAVGRELKGPWPRRAIFDAGAVLDGAAAEPIRKSGCRWRRSARSGKGSPKSMPTTCISRRRVRSACRRGSIAAIPASASPPAITPVSPNMWRPACRFRRSGATPSCSWFHSGARRRWCRPNRSPTNCGSAASATSSSGRAASTATAFAPGPKTEYAELPGPHLLYVGRVAVEKNVKSFLDLQVPGSKIVVGDGPELEQLRQAQPR